MSGTVLETGDATVNHTGYNLLLYGAFCDMDKVSTNKYMYNYSGECSKHSLKTFFFFFFRKMYIRKDSETIALMEFENISV